MVSDRVLEEPPRRAHRCPIGYEVRSLFRTSSPVACKTCNCPSVLGRGSLDRTGPSGQPRRVRETTAALDVDWATGDVLVRACRLGSREDCIESAVRDPDILRFQPTVVAEW